MVTADAVGKISIKYGLLLPGGAPPGGPPMLPRGTASKSGRPGLAEEEGVCFVKQWIACVKWRGRKGQRAKGGQGERSKVEQSIGKGVRRSAKKGRSR
jgi:hypothetical protein